MTKEAPMKKLLFQVKTENICVTKGGKKSSLAATLVFYKIKLSANDSRLVNIPFTQKRDIFRVKQSLGYCVAE